MFGGTIIFTGSVVIGETAFRWSVTDGQAQQLIVSHPTLGTQIQRLTASPDSQARDIGRAMLRDAANAAAMSVIDAVDDVPVQTGDPEPTIV
jgi:hypothetical protein